MEENKDKQQKNEQIEIYAKKIMQLAKDTITVKFRFFDQALTMLQLKSKPGIGQFATDGRHIYYDSASLLLTYMEEPNVAVRALLHILLHCIFSHSFQYEKKNMEYWDLAIDIAVENIILEMDLSSASLSRDSDARSQITKISKWVPQLSAERIYREFMVNGLSMDAQTRYRKLFQVDNHDFWRGTAKEEVIISEKEWKKISERIKTDLKTFSKDKANSESLQQNLEEATRQHYDYRSILERFMVSGEELHVNDDEFDYIYYTYGLATYGNLPLIEPLEYKEVHKVREFVIALDTSASCRGQIVKSFLRQTYDILKSADNFFHEVNVHIIQCDNQLQSDTVIRTEEDFLKFVEQGKLTGFGGTDFRPVFSYVDELIDNKTFENLKGLIYFTDGYGIYPERVPAYDVMFAFLNEDQNRAQVPNWALEIIIEEERL
ncbi:MAG: VWA-like domain-containing protein [Eubacteriales bacterium]|nr:VWA-like domain-containing protein [Eubacteriales bacterium]